MPAPSLANKFQNPMNVPPGVFNVPRFTQPQMQFQNQQLQAAQENLGTDAIEAQARRNYQANTIPQLSERFGRYGLGGSTGYQNAVKGAGTQLETNLAAMKQQNAFQQANIGLTPQYEQVYERPEGMTGAQAFGSTLGQYAPQVLGNLAEKGINSYFSNKNQPQQQAQQQAAQQGSSTGSNVANAALGGAAGAVGTAAGGALLSGGAGAGLAGLAAAAAPFALPVAGAAAAAFGLWALYKLISD